IGAEPGFKTAQMNIASGAITKILLDNGIGFIFTSAVIAFLAHQSDHVRTVDTQLIIACRQGRAAYAVSFSTIKFDTGSSAGSSAQILKRVAGITLQQL